MRAEHVAAWVEDVLADYKGRYEVCDHLFVRDAVRVVTVRRDAFYDISRERWTRDPDAESHSAIGQELLMWAQRVMPQRS
jgi:hypothetical protein